MLDVEAQGCDADGAVAVSGRSKPVLPHFR
jgi:hypothetical protein